VFYPSKIKDGQQQPASNASQSAHGEGEEFQSGTLRTTESRCAPARPPEDADMGAAADDERIPPNGVPIYPPSPTPKGPPHSGQRHTS
jgi:hypothetical protein